MSYDYSPALSSPTNREAEATNFDPSCDAHLYAHWTPEKPLVTVTMTEPDSLDVKVFGIPYNPPAGFPPLTRSMFGLLMDHLYERFGQAFSIELIETDGTRETGTIDLRSKPKHGIEVLDSAGTESPAHEQVDVPLEYGGFQPGENILIANLCHTDQADDQGILRFVPPPEYTRIPLFMIGRTSGTISTRQPVVE